MTPSNLSRCQFGTLASVSAIAAMLQTQIEAAASPPHTPSAHHIQGQHDPAHSKAISPPINPAETQSSSGSSPSPLSARPSPSLL